MIRTLPLILLLFLLVLCQCTPPKNEKLTEVQRDLNNPEWIRVMNFQDQQLSDSLYRFFRHKDPTLRHAAALAFASSKDPAGIDSLAILLTDEIESVRTAAAYALGQIGQPEAEPYLIEAFQSLDTGFVWAEFNAAILEAIGKSGTAASLEALSTISTYLPTDTLLLEGQAWGLYRFALRDMISEEGTETMLTYATDLRYPTEVQFIAANYLSRMRDKLDLKEQDTPLADALNRSDDPRIRMALAMALGSTGTETAFNALVSRMNIDQDYRVKCNILRALKYFDYETAKPVAWAAVEDPRLPIALTAADYFLENGIPTDAREYWIKAKDSLAWETQLRLYQAAMRHLPDYFSTTKGIINTELQARYANTVNPYEKAAALKALGEFGWNYRYIRQIALPSEYPVVRITSIEALKSIVTVDDFRAYFGGSYRPVRQEISNFLVNVFENGDPGMIALAAEIFRTPGLSFRGTLDSLDFMETALANLKLPQEIETYHQVQQTLDFFNGVKDRPKREPAFNHPINWELLQSLPADPVVQLETEKGNIQIRLFPLLAPGTVANFCQLVQDSFYNQKNFHRIVPNFVIQGGCPRGDGYGSLDYSIRSELPYLHYDRQGYVGMASAGNHTEGTQFFITHAPAPHLDGSYTIFAEVIVGMDVVHQIGTGDRILSVTFVEPPAASD